MACVEVLDVAFDRGSTKLGNPSFENLIFEFGKIKDS